MNISALFATALVALAALPAAVQAQAVVPSGKAPGQARQSAIAQQCAACHGQQGEGQAGAPRIAGQPRQYLEKQLQSYANGSRRNPTMEAVAKPMSPQEMADFAAHYAQLDAPAAKLGGATAVGAEQVERGRVLALKGNSARQVQACINCHGPNGAGEPPAIPYLSGLDAGYLIAAMNAWKDRSRKNDAGQQMATVVQPMTADDIAAVAHYYASLPPPKPAPPDIVTPPHVSKPPSPAPASGPQPGVHPRIAQKPEAGTADSTLIKQPVQAGDPARGRAIVASGVHGCGGCHAIPGIRGARGIVGPPLTGLAERSFLAGQLPNNTNVLVAFLQNPASLVPQTGMPNVGLGSREARDIAAFLYTLGPVHAP